MTVNAAGVGVAATADRVATEPGAGTMRQHERRPRWSPLVVTRLRRSPHRLLAAMKATQGDLARVRFGRSTLVLVSGPDDIRRVLVTDDRDFPRRNIPTKRWLRQPRPEQAGVTLGPGGDPELRLLFRRALQPTYARTRIDGYWPQFRRVVDETVGRWRPGEPFDLVGRIEPLALELVVRAVFGRPPAIPIGELVDQTRACLDRRAYASSTGYRLADRLRLRGNLRAASAYEALASLMSRQLDERRREPGDEDVLTQLLAVDEGRPLGDDQLVVEALGQLFVGSEPVGSGAAWALALLGQDSSAFRRVREEADGGPPAQSSFLRAALSETLRLHPPFTLIGRQSRLETELGGQRVRAGDHVFVCPYLVHRDERWWPHATTFDPSRWLAGGADDRPRLAYLPFGAGPRQCVGEHVAWRAMEAIVVAVAARWDLVALGSPPRPTALRPSGLDVRVEEPS